MHKVKATQEPIGRPVVGSPATKAAFTAIIYLVICAVYIVVSGVLAEKTAANAAELRQIETVKGVVFVAVTALAFYLISLARWKRIRRQEERIIEQQAALTREGQRNAAALYSAALAHDLGNLLFAAQGLLDKLSEREREDPTLADLRTGLEDAISGLSSLARRLSATASNVLPESRCKVGLREVVDRVASLVRHHPDLRRSEIRSVDVPDIRIWVNAAMFEDALLNLLVNAGQAAGPEAGIEIRAGEDGMWLQLEVHDDGPGIPEEERERIFVPCYTTKPDGTGLGLLSVVAFSATCDGEVTADDSELGGACFTIRMPKEAVAVPC